MTRVTVNCLVMICDPKKTSIPNSDQQCSGNRWKKDPVEGQESNGKDPNINQQSETWKSWSHSLSSVFFRLGLLTVTTFSKELYLFPQCCILLENTNKNLGIGCSDKTLTKSNLGMELFYFCLPFQVAVKSEQELQAGTWSRSHRGIVLHAALLLIELAFLHSSGPPAQG